MADQMPFQTHVIHDHKVEAPDDIPDHADWIHGQAVLTIQFTTTDTTVQMPFQTTCMPTHMSWAPVVIQFHTV